MIGGRSPKMAEQTLEVLSEDAILVYLAYTNQLKSLFAEYIPANFNERNNPDPKKRKSVKEIEEKNIKMEVSGFLKLCRCKHLIQNLIPNPETLQQYIIQTIPPVTNEEYDFLEKDKELLTLYKDD